MDNIFRFYKTINSDSEIEFLVVDLYLENFQRLISNGINFTYSLENKFLTIHKKEDKPFSISFENVLKEHIDEENQRSKKLLSELSLSNNINIDNLIVRLKNELQELINDNYVFYNEYPFIYDSLDEILQYINKYIVPGDNNKIELDTSKILTFNSSNKIINKIEEIFSFFKGKNEKGEIILDFNDYEYLKEKILFLVTNNSVPEIERKLKPKLNVNTLSFCFWVLHKELFTSKKIKDNFIDTLQKLFINYKDQEKSSIKKQLGTKSRVTQRKILPKIILNYLV
ncbi:hypothetical protein [Empedobacter sp. UBA5987]|uniref:hypothetical protein n=1 Tax=Empedobacter sp. UBA5987 TaxID=1946444 RepID=UPI0025C72C59|nr:hypothetical protein [Empedobacter sp. UBA5987]